MDQSIPNNDGHVNVRPEWLPTLTPSTDPKPSKETEPEPKSERVLSPPPTQLHTDILSVSRSGNLLVTNITKYLSTLPHPIEIVEELVAVSAVTSSLLLSLHSSLLRFQHLNLSSTLSFIQPLCHDILFAFKLLSDRVQEAKRMRVFEPNDVGLVRLPRAAWTLVLGTEAKVASLRSRLFVEKYRVRVLIEAVVYEGLRTLGKDGRSKKEEDEWRSLKKMVPLVAERLVGVQRDYTPRLMRLRGLVVDENLLLPEPVVRGVTVRNVVVSERPVPVPSPAPTPAVEATPVIEAEAETKEEPLDEKAALKPSHSSLSLASSTTAIETPDTDIKYETWVLRYNQPHKYLASRTSVFGIPLLSKHTYSKKTFYTRPISSSTTEISNLLTNCLGSKSPADHKSTFTKKVLSMPNAAQREIQALIEARQIACSSEKASRRWEVIGFMERNRRNISQKQRWWKKKVFVEWVLVLRGVTRDCDERVVQTNYTNPWKAEDEAREARENPVVPVVVPEAVVPVVEVKVEKPVQTQQGIVLRHVENRRALSIEEAEIKMSEIISDLFIQNEGFDTDSEDEDEESDEDEEQGEDEVEIEIARPVEKSTCGTV
ncbi:hypothetical protein VTL71DRAFT_12087 [Oculimacula yallundae]|uniref:Uncharacterized protein n=1 Tax=Oculimacula yallundae TaxID=86028 RepID=A0ABR4CRY4_9HELO